jgi:hypothetical protein
MDRSLEQTLGQPRALRTSDKIFLQPRHRNLRKRPFVYLACPLYRKFGVFAICYETLPRFTARSLTLA